MVLLGVVDDDLSTDCEELEIKDGLEVDEVIPLKAEPGSWC